MATEGMMSGGFDPGSGGQSPDVNPVAEQGAVAAYDDYRRYLASGQVDKVQGILAAEVRARVGKGPFSAALLRVARNATPDFVASRATLATGQRATLATEGPGPMGLESGIVELVWEDLGWRILKETWTCPGCAQTAPPVVAGAAAAPAPSLGGGEADAAGAAYLVYCRALREGDIAAVKEHLVSDKRAEVDAVPALLVAGIFKVAASVLPAEVKLLKAEVSGDEAVLTAQDAKGGKMTATIRMRKEGGRWRVREESWSNEMPSAGSPSTPAR